MPDVAAVEIAAGRAEPMPDFLPLLGLAERWGSPPWALLEGRSAPRSWWIRAALVLDAAKADADARRSRTKR